MIGKNHFKLLFVFTFVLALVACFLPGDTASRRVFAFPGGPPDGFSGSPFPDRQYMEHTLAGNFRGRTGGVTWTFNWVAPAKDAGPVTFNAALNQGNFDGTDSGDEIYTTSQTVQNQSLPPGPPPVILSASIVGKNLFVMGQNFDSSSLLTVDEVEQRTVFDPRNPMILTGRKSGKRIHVGDTVTLEVINADTGETSEAFSFTRN